MDAEQIVRALAASSPPRYRSWSWESEGICVLCGEDGRSEEGAADPKRHDSNCPWRLAKEWAAANTTVVLATASVPLFENDPPTS